jgi:hypothetical protein
MYFSSKSVFAPPGDAVSVDEAKPVPLRARGGISNYAKEFTGKVRRKRPTPMKMRIIFDAPSDF